MKKCYEVNRRFVAAVTSIGGHEAQCLSVAADLKLPVPVQTYSEHVSDMSKISSEVALESMTCAADEAKRAQGPDIIASFDGTWQKRGFKSRNGVTTAVTCLGKHGANKVVDTHVMTSYCNGCQQHGKDNVKLITIKKHKCAINHAGSAGKMEVDGVMQLFRRSEEKYGIRYTGYLGDGDSKAYHNVSAANVYTCPVKKLECTGHVQKRMGKALMTLVEQHKGKSFVVDSAGRLLKNSAPDKKKNEKMYKGIGGIGRLTTPAIKSIQGHYGAAIRSHDNVDDMKSAIWAIFYHRSGDHSKCSTWCPAVHSGNDAKANKHKLPVFVTELMKPVFERLSDSDLLKRCEHGGTQNSNESFHHLIWSKCPKEIFSSRKRIELAVSEATVIYNDGYTGRVKLLRAYGLNVGERELSYARQKDLRRVKEAETSCSESKKAKRKQSSINNTDKDYSAGDF